MRINKTNIFPQLVMNDHRWSVTLVIPLKIERRKLRRKSDDVRLSSRKKW
jgi:hypothetical protein